MKITQEHIDALKELLLTYGTKILIAVVLLLAGLWIIKKVTKLSLKIMENRNVGYSLRIFLKNILNIGLLLLLFIAVLSYVGVKTAWFITILGAAGLAIGMALQGSLSNFAGGVLILFFKLFKVGDMIKAQGEIGEVIEIQMFMTKLSTQGNKTAIIPNGKLANGNIINYNQGGKLRVDLTIGISYGSDIKKAREVLLEVMSKHPDILNNPQPEVNVSELAESSVDLIMRPWTTPEKYWKVRFDVLEASKEALDKANISIPFPQRDIHIIDKNEG